MKKLFLLLPILVLTLTGCNADMKSMEEAYGVFKEEMVNGYTVVEEIDGAVITLDFTSETEYSIEYKDGEDSFVLTCGNPEESTAKMEGIPDETGADVADYCEEMYDVFLEDIKNNVENVMFYDSAYLVDYESTDAGFEAIGTYEDDTTNSLKINAENTKVEFEDTEGKITIELK